MALPIMPKATAVWLIDNTSLTFDQIADFSGLHTIEIQAIADGDIATNVHGENPIESGQLTQKQIDECQNDPKKRLKLRENPLLKKRIGAKYTPINKRQSKPDGVLWLIQNRPELSDKQIMKLVGTTKTTIESIRDRSHKNYAILEAKDPVILGLCNINEMDIAMNEAIAQNAKKEETSILEE